MKRAILILLALVILPAVFAEIEVLQISARKTTLLDRLPFSIVPNKVIYDPGERADVSIETAVDCNTKTAIFTITGPSGGEEYFMNVGSLIWVCSSQIFNIQFIVPDEPGKYEMKITYEDGRGVLLFQEKSYFLVSGGEQECPVSFCDDWKNVDFTANGFIQQQSCYVYSQSNNCNVQVDVVTRLKCDVGYEKGRQWTCKSIAGNPVCGNGNIETGEECDLGFGNSVCPAGCDLTCHDSNCADLPLPEDPNEEPPPPSDAALLPWILGGLALLLLLIIAIVGFLVK